MSLFPRTPFPGRLRTALAMCLVASVIPLAASTAEASVFVRAGFEDLTKANETVVLAEAVDAHSYWNSDGSFILTDVRLRITETVVGSSRTKAGIVDELTVTLLGGTVGDRSTLIVGGARLEAGASYMLFLDNGNLPGARNILTVPAHAQGVFDVEEVGGELRAVSQANGHGLLPDLSGESLPPGGDEGLPLDRAIEKVKSAAEEAIR